MKKFFSIVLLLSLLLTTLFANRLEDAAFSEYKKKNYTLAFTLYTKAASRKSLKSLLMLGLFFERGLGVQKDKNRAIKFYKLILKNSSNIKKLIKDEKKSKIAIIALMRLYTLTKNKRYKQLADKLTTLKEQQSRQEQPLFDDTTTMVDDFFILCPFAALVAPEDREGIESFDCALFENFPREMVLFMHLRRLRFEALAVKSKNMLPIIKRLNAKITQTIQPMLKFLKKEAIKCYQQSEELSDIKSCDYDYLSKSDPLLFDNAAYKMEMANKKKSFKNYKLDIFEKNDLINELIAKISKNEYGKPYRTMVK